MTTEHQTAPDFPERRQPEDAVSGDTSDGESLDPSVFFGLFDNLDESQSEEAESHEDGAVGRGNDNGTAATQPVQENDWDLQVEDAVNSNRDRLSVDEVSQVDGDGGQPGTQLLDDNSSHNQPSAASPDTDDMDLDDAIGLVLGTADEDGSDRQVVNPSGDGVAALDATGHDGEAGGGAHSGLTDVTVDGPTGETTVEASGPGDRPPATAPSPPPLPSADSPGTTDPSADGGYEAYQPPLFPQRPDTFFEPQNHDSVVLGSVAEPTLDPYPVDRDYTASSNPAPSNTFSPHADAYVHDERQHQTLQHPDPLLDRGVQEPFNRTGSDRQDSSLTVTAVVMTIAASFAVGLIGLAAMFALTDGDSESVSQEAGADQVTSSSLDVTQPTDSQSETAAAQPDLEDTDNATAETLTVDGGAEAVEGDETNPLLNPVGAMTAAIDQGRLDLLALEFVPGTTDLTAESAALVKTLAPRITELGSPVTATIRANSESTAQGNVDLSQGQAESLVAAFVTAGVPETQIRVNALGAGPLSAALPVPDFVAAAPELGDSVFSESVAASGPFTIGSQFNNPGLLRIEAVTDAARLRQAMDRFTDSTIGLAAYSFFAVDNQTARAAATQLANTVVAELTSGEVTANRITVIAAGAAPYVVTPELGGHVWLQTGADSSTSFDVAGIDTATISFEPSSAALTAEGQAALDQLASVLAGDSVSLTVDVRAYSEPSPEANTTLSQQQAAEVGRYLGEIGGIAETRLRAYGSGPSTYYPDNGGTTVTLTVGPRS